MNNETFETYLKETIDTNLYIEPTNQNDLDRVMLANTPKGNLYICAVPKKGVKDELDQAYRSDHDQVFPTKEMIEEKIKNFIEHLEENLELYD